MKDPLTLQFLALLAFLALWVAFREYGRYQDEKNRRRFRELVQEQLCKKP